MVHLVHHFAGISQVQGSNWCTPYTIWLGFRRSRAMNGAPRTPRKAILPGKLRARYIMCTILTGLFRSATQNGTSCVPRRASLAENLDRSVQHVYQTHIMYLSLSDGSSEPRLNARDISRQHSQLRDKIRKPKPRPDYLVFSLSAIVTLIYHVLFADLARMSLRTRLCDKVCPSLPICPDKATPSNV